jgi:hypothetical protein
MSTVLRVGVMGATLKDAAYSRRDSLHFASFSCAYGVTRQAGTITLVSNSGTDIDET